jgi:hypothetical protein
MTGSRSSSEFTTLDKISKHANYKHTDNAVHGCVRKDHIMGRIENIAMLAAFFGFQFLAVGTILIS